MKIDERIIPYIENNIKDAFFELAKKGYDLISFYDVWGDTELCTIFDRNECNPYCMESGPLIAETIEKVLKGSLYELGNHYSDIEVYLISEVYRWLKEFQYKSELSTSCITDTVSYKELYDAIYADYDGSNSTQWELYKSKLRPLVERYI